MKLPKPELSPAAARAVNDAFAAELQAAIAKRRAALNLP